MKRDTEPSENRERSKYSSGNAGNASGQHSFIDILADADKSYGVLAEAASDAILRINHESVIEFVNSAAVRVFGHPVEEMLGQPLTMLMPEELRDRHMAGFGRYLATGERHLNWQSIEIVGLHKTGRTFPLEISFGEYQSDSQRFFVGIARDISRRKATERALKESEENFRSLANSISQLAWMADAEGSIFWYNDRWFDYTGTTLEEMKGLGWQAVHHPSSVAPVTEKFMRHVASGDEWEDTFLLRSSSGVYRWFLSRAEPIRDAEGRITRWFGTNTDIDEVRRAQEILNTARKELQVRVEERTSELAAANHELVIESAKRQKAQEERVELLGRLLTSQEDERRRIARDMHDHFGQQLTALRLQLSALRDLCDDEIVCDKVSETQKIAEQLDSDVSFLVWELRPTALDDLGLEAALEHYIDKWSSQFEIPVDFHVREYDPESVSVEARSSVYRIAQEALNNIYKHAGAQRINVLLESRASELMLIIEDDGRGFDVDDKEASRTGFGLVGMSERAALVGGKLEIESAAGIGTTLFIRIPVNRNEPLG